MGYKVRIILRYYQTSWTSGFKSSAQFLLQADFSEKYMSNKYIKVNFTS